MNNDEKISSIIKEYGAFWAFGNKQLEEQKKEGIRYMSLGAGLVCPVDHAKKLVDDLATATKEIKAEEKRKRKERAEKLKNAKLPKSERVQNRKILIIEAMERINNFADDCYIAEHYRMIENSKSEKCTRAINSLLSAIACRYHDRADYEPEIKEVYDENIKIIKQLRDEIISIVNE